MLSAVKLRTEQIPETLWKIKTTFFHFLFQKQLSSKLILTFFQASPCPKVQWTNQNLSWEKLFSYFKKCQVEIDFSKEDCAQLVINRLQSTYYANSKAHFSQQNQSNTSLSKWWPNKWGHKAQIWSNFCNVKYLVNWTEIVLKR